MQFISEAEKSFVSENAEGIRLAISESMNGIDGMDLESLTDAYDVVWLAEELVKKLADMIEGHYKFVADL